MHKSFTRAIGLLPNIEETVYEGKDEAQARQTQSAKGNHWRRGCAHVYTVSINRSFVLKFGDTHINFYTDIKQIIDYMFRVKGLASRLCSFSQRRWTTQKDRAALVLRLWVLLLCSTTSLSHRPWALFKDLNIWIDLWKIIPTCRPQRLAVPVTSRFDGWSYHRSCLTTRINGVFSLK